MFLVKDVDTGQTIQGPTSAANALYWLESQGESIATATGLLETAKQGVSVRVGAITVEAV